MRLCKDLRNRRIEHFQDDKDISPGEVILEKLGEGIGKAEIVVLVLSQHSVKSEWVKRELSTAFPKTIVPMRIDNCSIPDGLLMHLQSIKYIDAHDYEEGFYGLLKVLDGKKAETYRRDHLEPKRKERILGGIKVNISFGRFHELSVFNIAGGESSDFNYGDMTFMYEDIPKILPHDLERTRHELLKEKLAEVRRTGAALEDNLLVYVRQLAVLTEAADKLHVTFGPSSYLQYAPFMYNLDRKLYSSDKTIREAYFSTPWDFEHSPVPSEVSVNLNVICDSGNTILILQRGQRVAVAPGRLAETVGGAVNRKYDWDHTMKSPSPFLAAIREAKEELNLDIEKEQITFRAIILGLEDPAVCFLGDVYVNESSDSLLKGFRFAQTKEGIGYHPIPFEPEAVSSFLRQNNDNITHISLYTILSTLCASRNYGWRNVEKAFNS